MKKANLKKLISCLLVTLILSIFLTSCGEAADTVPEEENAPVYKDLGGAHFIFATGWTIEYMPEVGRTISGDKMRQRYADAEEKFNCTFEVLQYTEGTTSQYILNAVAIGEGIPDMCDAHATNAFPAYKAELLYPLDEINTIDLSDPKWGPEKFRQYGTWDGLSYGFFPYDWEFIPQFAGALLFNNELIKSFGISPTPYELQEQDQWNWENFKDILIACTVTGGETPQIGLNIENVNNFVKTVIFSNGGHIMKQNSETGTWEFSLSSPEVMQAAEYIKELKNLKVYNQTWNLDDFTLNKKYTFINSESWYATVNVTGYNLPTLYMDDFGFLPFPHGPMGNKETVSAYVHTGRRLNWIVGPSYNDKDDFGLLLNYIFSPLDDSEPQAWKKLARDQYFLHLEDYNNFVYMTENCNYDYSAELWDVSGHLNTIYTAIMNGQPVSTAADKIREAVQREIDEVMNVAQ